MQFGNRRIRGLAPLLACVALALSCSDPSGPGDGPDPGPPGESVFTARVLVHGDTVAIHDEPPGWLDDDEHVLYAAGPGSCIWMAAADTGAPPVPITDPDQEFWILGGHFPAGIAEGRVCYFKGYLPASFGMHLLAADSTTVAETPEPDVVRTFLGTSVGLAPNQISSPRSLSVDDQVHRAVGTWDRTWYMTWEGADDEATLVVSPATGLEDAVDFRISPDGSRIAYVGADGVVYWMPFHTTEAHAVATGSHPSFSGDGNLLGFVPEGGTDYAVHDIAEDETTVFEGRASLHPLKPVLSRRGNRVVFIVETGGVRSLYVGSLDS